MNLLERAREYEEQYGFPYELLIEAILALIEQCSERRLRELQAMAELPALVRIVMARKLRQHLREERILGIRVFPVRDQLADDFLAMNPEQFNSFYGQCQACLVDPEGNMF